MADDARQLDSFTEGFVRKSARRLAGKFGFSRDDREEIEQILYLKLAKHLPAADPDSPRWKAFVAVTVRRQISNLVRACLAEKRHRHVTSIHVVVDEDGLLDLASTIEDSERGKHAGISRRDDIELTELRLDVAEALSALSDETLRAYCESLKQESLSQAARDAGIPRTTMASRLGKVRKVFENKGLKNYI